jgi:putative nucleotidyltransferase with HDIG domain
VNMTAVSTEDRLRARIAELERELEVATRSREALDQAQQLKFAEDVNKTFKAERARTKQLEESYMLTVRALASAVEARDAYLARHAERVAAYGLEIATAAGMNLGENRQVEYGFLLHDAGKVAVPDAILFKPGPLTPDERAVIEQHPVKGAEIVRDIEFLGAARDVIRWHHERWDGTGYPDRLAGTDIPLSARVFAVADALDALTSDRPYRRASSLPQARLAIVRDSGTHFDPDVVAAFESLPDSVLERIREEIR